MKAIVCIISAWIHKQIICDSQRNQIPFFWKLTYVTMTPFNTEDRLKKPTQGMIHDPKGTNNDLLVLQKVIPPIQ